MPDASLTGAAADPAATSHFPDPDATTAGDNPTAAGTPAPAAGGRYALGEEIARGGMGIVYRSADSVLGREVAVKVLQGRYGPESGAARRFAEEARITGQLQHPGIPPVHDLGTLPDGRPFLAMKLIRGQTLEALRTGEPGRSANLTGVFEAICQAVAYAHAQNVIHRDLKPANVMVGNFGEVQVMDWGLAKVLVGGVGDADPVRPGPAAADGSVVLSPRDTDGSFT